jgi:hypothetical protein
MKTFLISLTTALAALSMPTQAATPAAVSVFSTVTANASFGIDHVIEAKKKGKKGHSKHKKG